MTKTEIEAYIGKQAIALKDGKAIDEVTGETSKVKPGQDLGLIDGIEGPDGSLNFSTSLGLLVPANNIINTSTTTNKSGSDKKQKKGTPETSILGFGDKHGNRVGLGAFGIHWTVGSEFDLMLDNLLIVIVAYVISIATGNVRIFYTGLLIVSIKIAIDNGLGAPGEAENNFQQ